MVAQLKGFDVQITRLYIYPSYLHGFSFNWELDPSQPPPAGVQYHVQRGDTHDGPWHDISPAIADSYYWSGDEERVVHTKEPVLYFRIRATAGAQEYYSPVVQPYGGIADKREFLIARNMRRQELIQMQGMGGTACKVLVKAIFGPRCERCTDFVTGRPARQDCIGCFGIGIDPGYHGPYDTLARFSAERVEKGFGEGNNYVTEQVMYRLRMLGTPHIKKDDIIVDTTTGRRYMVNQTAGLVEVRRVPIVRTVTVSEIPSQSPYYRIEA